MAAFNEQNPQPPLVGHNGAGEPPSTWPPTWIDRKVFHSNLPSVAVDLLGCKAVARLGGVGHTIARFTERGQHLAHSRLEFAIETLNIADRFAQRLGMSEADRGIVCSIALLEETATPALGRAGEAALSRDLEHPFDRTVEQVSMVCGSSHEIHQTLIRHGIDPLAVANALEAQSGKHDTHRFVVHSLARPLAYLEESILGSDLPEYIKRLARVSADEIVESIMPRGTEASSDLNFSFNDTLPLMQMQALRRLLAEQILCSPSAALVESALIEAISGALQNGSLTASELLKLGDEEVLSRFPDATRQVFGQAIENSFHVLTIIPERGYTIQASDLHRGAKALTIALRGSLSCDALFCAATNEFGSTLEVEKRKDNGDASTVTVRATESPATRAMAIGFPKAQSEEWIFSAASAIKRSIAFLKIYVTIKPDDTSDLDPRLFRHA